MAQRLHDLLSAIPLRLAHADGVPTAPSEFILLRDGELGWAGMQGVRLDAESARKIIGTFDGFGNKLVIDYHHSTEHIQPGQKAPAAGWIGGLRYTPGEGLYATGVEWTPEARAEIEAGKFKYVSPVIGYDEAADNEITWVMSVALTNRPRTIGATELVAAAELEIGDKRMTTKPVKKAEGQDGPALPAAAPEKLSEVIDALRAKGVEIADDASVEDVLASVLDLLAAKPEITETPADEAEAKIRDEHCKELETKLAEATKRLEVIEAEKKEAEVERLIEAQIEAGKLNPHNEPLLAAAREMASHDTERFKKLYGAMEAMPGTKNVAHEPTPIAREGLRKTLIRKAAASFDQAAPNQRLNLTKAAWVDGDLREANLVKLSEAEIQAL